MIRRIFALLLIAVLLSQAIAFAGAAPVVGAETAVLIDAKTKKVLYAVDPGKIMYPASTTKMMTLLVALESGNLDSVVTISSKAASCEESSLGLKAGDKLTLRELITGMMVVSGNDAAEAVAEHIAGAVPAFVEMMNNRADKLGLSNTHFSNPHGLPDPINHYSTARDLALIAAAGMENPEFAKIVSLREYTVNFLNRSPLKVYTTNKFLKSYDGADGIKTGYTEEAGDCLVAGARRKGVQLIAVVLNDDDRWIDVPKLMDYGFWRVATEKN